MTNAKPYKKRAIPNAVRREVCEKAGASFGKSIAAYCTYCGAEGHIDWTLQRYWPSIGDLELDHVNPEFLGGAATAENIVLACRSCNRKKGVNVS